MAHPRGVRRERTLCGICRARGVNARTCPARGIEAEYPGASVGIAANVEQYGEQYREWVAEAHADLMQPRKFAEMMRERMAAFNGQSTLNVGIPMVMHRLPDPVDVDEDGVGSPQNKSGRAGNVERMMRAVEAGIEAFIAALQN